MISLELYLGQHKAEAQPGDLTEEIRANAAELVKRVNALLAAFGVSRVQRSGWRPPAFNETFAHKDARGETIRGGAPKSKHMTGEAVDLADNDGVLDAWLNDERLAEFDLYREHPDSTPTWAHLQIVPTASGNRTFHP